MRYLHVIWHHDDSDDPVELYSELDAGSWEIRKIERFRDGTLGWADARESSTQTRLGLEPVPSVAEINQSSEFSASEIDQQEFAAVWISARDSRTPSPVNRV